MWIERDMFLSGAIKDMHKVLGDVVKPAAQGRVFCAALQSVISYDTLGSWKKKKEGVPETYWNDKMGDSRELKCEALTGVYNKGLCITMY